jgi:hypothetical protein
MKYWISLGVAVLLPVALVRADPPELQEGLWGQHTQTVNNPGNKKTEATEKKCSSHDLDKKGYAVWKATKGCSVTSESTLAGVYTQVTSCNVSVADAGRFTSKVTMTIRGDTSVHAESQTTYTPAIDGVTDSSSIIDAKYLGSCPAGMKPGDMIGEDGKIVHLGG